MERAPSVTSEDDFWNTPPSYPAASLPPEDLPDTVRPPGPRRRRLRLARSVFATVIAAAALLLFCAVLLKVAGLR